MRTSVCSKSAGQKVCGTVFVLHMKIGCATVGQSLPGAKVISLLCRAHRGQVHITPKQGTHQIEMYVAGG